MAAWRRRPSWHRVLKYLSRYTHRVAITNGRILFVGDGTVRFAWKDYADHNITKQMTLSAQGRRFLLHVLPRGFMRIRQGWGGGHGATGAVGGDPAAVSHRGRDSVGDRSAARARSQDRAPLRRAAGVAAVSAPCANGHAVGREQGSAAPGRAESSPPGVPARPREPDRSPTASPAPPARVAPRGAVPARWRGSAGRADDS